MAGNGAGLLSHADGGKAPRKRALPCAPSRSRPMRESHCFYGAHTDPRPQGEGVRARGWKSRIVSGKMDEATYAGIECGDNGQRKTPDGKRKRPRG